MRFTLLAVDSPHSTLTDLEKVSSLKDFYGSSISKILFQNFSQNLSSSKYKKFLKSETAFTKLRSIVFTIKKTTFT